MTRYKITEARNAKGWSQADLAKKIGTSQQQIARYESGDNDVKSSVLVKLSSALGVTITYLLGLDDASSTDSEDRQLDRLCRNYRDMSDEGKQALAATSDALLSVFEKRAGGGVLPCLVQPIRASLRNAALRFVWKVERHLPWSMKTSAKLSRVIRSARSSYLTPRRLEPTVRVTSCCRSRYVTDMAISCSAHI